VPDVRLRAVGSWGAQWQRSRHGRLQRALRWRAPRGAAVAPVPARAGMGPGEIQYGSVGARAPALVGPGRLDHWLQWRTRRITVSRPEQGSACSPPCI